MKNIILKNPEQAQEIFTNNGKTDENYFIKVYSDTTEVILNGEVYSTSISGDSLNIRFGSAYTILLEKFDNEVIFEIKDIGGDIDGLGVLLLVNQIPYCLRVFWTSNETQLQQIREYYPDLRIIDFGSDGSKGIKYLNEIAAFRNLKELNLNQCKNLNDISGLQSLNHLETLWLDGFTDTRQFHFITCCKNLRNLSQSGSELTSIKHVSSLDLLELLDISSNSGLTDLSPLSGLSALTNLNLGMCENLTDLSPLSGLSALTNLNLEFCEKLTDLSPLSGLKYLKNLDLSFCGALTDLSPLSRLSALKNLNLKWCTQLTDLSPLSGLSALTNINLEYCTDLTDLSPLSGLSALTNLDFSSCRNLTDLSPLSGLNSLKILYLSFCENLTDLSPLSGLSALTDLGLYNCEKLTDLSPLSGLSALTNLRLSSCDNLSDVSPILGMSALTCLDLSNIKKITRIKNICSIENLKELYLDGCSNIRDFESLASLHFLEKLEWIDPLACSLILMQSAFNRHDKKYIVVNAEKWIGEIELSKDATDYLSKLLRAVSLLKGDNNHQLITALSTAMRSRGLQSEGINDLDAFTWETWCNLVLELELPDAVNCLKSAVTDLEIQRETEVLLGPILIAASEIIEKYSSEKGHLLDWVNEQLQQLHDYPTEERQVAPSAAVFYASLNMKDEVLFWLAKATDEKAPLWQDKVVVALINYYARKEEFTECRRLLDQIKIEDQKDLAISSIAVAMGDKYPVQAAFLLDDIKELSISIAAAKRLLQNSSVLSTPQGIYQLLLHLQSNTEELSSTITTLIDKDQEGKVAHAVKQLFLQKQPTGPSAAVLLELCKHPAISDFVKPRVLEKYKTNLLERVKKESAESIELLLSEMQLEEMIDQEEANELLQLMQRS